MAAFNYEDDVLIATQGNVRTRIVMVDENTPGQVLYGVRELAEDPAVGEVMAGPVQWVLEAELLAA